MSKQRTSSFLTGGECSLRLCVSPAMPRSVSGFMGFLATWKAGSTHPLKLGLWRWGESSLPPGSSISCTASTQPPRLRRAALRAAPDSGLRSLSPKSYSPTDRTAQGRASQKTVLNSRKSPHTATLGSGARRRWSSGLQRQAAKANSPASQPANNIADGCKFSSLLIQLPLGQSTDGHSDLVASYMTGSLGAVPAPTTLLPPSRSEVLCGAVASVEVRSPPTQTKQDLSPFLIMLTQRRPLRCRLADPEALQVA